MTTSMRTRPAILGGAMLLASALFVGCAESASSTTTSGSAAESTPVSAVAPTAASAVDRSGDSDGAAQLVLATLDTDYDLDALAESLAASEAKARPNPGNIGELAGSAAPAGAGRSGLVRSTIRYTGGINLAEGEQKSYDFGKIREGDLREKIFELVSDGPEALIIKGVKPSCGCTKAEIELYNDDGTVTAYERGTEIPTGKRFRLVTEISAEGKQGAFGTSVSIYTNAPGGTFNVRLAAIAEPILVVTPAPTIFFGQMTTVDQAKESVHVASTRGERFTLKSVTTNLPKSIQLEVVPVDPDDEGKAAEWDVTVVAGPGLPSGIRNYPCAVRSDIEILKPKHPKPGGEPTFYTISLAVQARVTGMVNATPAFLGFGMIRPGQAVDRTVLVESHDDFKLTADIPVSFEGLYGGEFEYADLMDATLVPSEDGSAMEIKLTLRGLPEEATGSFGGILKVAVGHPSIKELVIRFSGVCRLGLPGASGN